MEVAAGRSAHGTMYLCDGVLSKTSHPQISIGEKRLNSSIFKRKNSSAKASMITVASQSDPKKVPTLLSRRTLQTSTFPTGFEKLLLDVCDETDVAEVKLKVGDFEMNMKRCIGAPKIAPPIVSPTIAPPIPSEPMVGLVAVDPPVKQQKSSPAATNHFKNVSSSKTSKLAALEASTSNSYVLVPSPTVGSFRSGRTVKGRKQSPVCKKGDLIKEGQIIGYLDQFGNELPVKSNAAGEVLKVLYEDGEAVGFGDPLVAVLPSFHGISK